MSTLKEFTENLVGCINSLLQNCDIQASMQIVKKNNNVEKVGLEIREKGANMSAIIYTEDFQRKYESGISMDEIAKQVFTIAKNTRHENFDILQLTDYGKVKSRLALKLVNRKFNEEMLKDMPHRNVCDDMACICYIALEDPEDGKIMVHNGVFQNWNIPVSELMHTAMKNTERMYSAKVMDFEEEVKKIGMVPETGKLGNPMYIITHEGRVYGAVGALYKGLLDRLAEELESDLILIPSSVHEFLMMPKNTCPIGIGELNQMVREVNATQLQADEVLSDHVYLYCKETKDICGLAA